MVRKIRLFEAEEVLLLGLIREAQDSCFVRKTMSMSEYYTALAQYERRLVQLVEGLIETQNKKHNLVSFKSFRTRLCEQRVELLDSVRRAQEQYFARGLIDSRVYQAKQKSLTRRLGQIEKDITYHNAKRAIRTQTGLFKPLWQTYYKIIP